MEAVLRALADESRRTMLETLKSGPATAGELAALLPIAREGTSRHLRVLREAWLGQGRPEAAGRGHLPVAGGATRRPLRVLREAGLVQVRQEAQRRVYSLRPEPLAEVDEWLGRYRALWEQRLGALHHQRGRR